jgi:two-component system nitrogen regulation response regulator GlnG
MMLYAVESHRPRDIVPTAMAAKILVVDDERDIRDLLTDLLTREGYETLEADNGDTAVELISKHSAAVVILDLNLPKLSGMDVLRRTADVPGRAPVIMLTGVDDLRTAVQAMQLGAYDYLTKPLEPVALKLQIRRAVERQTLLAEIDDLKTQRVQSDSLGALVGNSAEIQTVIQRIRQVAGSTFTVLIQGETGTGKELAARALHHESRRRDRPFIAIDCGAIPDTLIESELFGYEKGAFTGADRRKEGHFSLADGGTLFLDEVANLPAATQAKLLRVLQERMVWRIGARTPTPIDVRIVAACNVSLEAASTSGAFREDLYYRLSEFPITLPPLRARRDDVTALALRFLDEASLELQRPVRGFEDDATRALLAYRWPGNVRELRNVVRRAVLVADGAITAADLSLPRSEPRGSDPEETATVSDFTSLKAARDHGAAEAERRAIRAALITARGNKSEAARLLKTDFKTLHVKMKHLGIGPGERHSA